MPSNVQTWQIDGKTVRDFIFLGSKIIADGDCSHEIKRCLLLVKKVMTNLDSILKSRDITSLTKVHIVKAMVFPVLWPAEFSKFAGILSAALSQHHLLEFEIAQLEFHHLPLALFLVMLPKAHLTSHSRMSGSR